MTSRYIHTYISHIVIENLIVLSLLFCVSGAFFDSLDAANAAQRLDSVFLALSPSQLAPGGEGLGGDELDAGTRCEERASACAAERAASNRLLESGDEPSGGP